jgi:hypothetical protein
MSNDPRLADPVILALAALRAKKNQGTAPRRTVTLKIVYAAGLDPIAEPAYEGPSYVYEETTDGWQPVPGDRTW